MSQQETIYTIALSRMLAYRPDVVLRLRSSLGSSLAVYEHRQHLREVLPDCSDHLCATLLDWQPHLQRAEHEMEFAGRHGVSTLCHGSEGYPQRLAQCPDAPPVLFYKGSTGLDARRVVSIVGTRHATSYGKDLTQHFVDELSRLCPETLVVSGLAYGIDIMAHRSALASGLPTVGVLAHGLDDVYPPLHRPTAVEMLSQGGLLTEYPSETSIERHHFVHRNRIVAGMADATIVVESAPRGGSLITAGLALDYGRSVFAFPGPVGATYSEGCNRLIRGNGAALITSAADFVEAVGWDIDAARQRAEAAGIERQLFPDLTPDEQQLADLLRQHGDLQPGQLSTLTGTPVGQIASLLFQMELKGVVRTVAGGTFHLIN